MLNALRLYTASKLLHWEKSVQQLSASIGLQRGRLSILLFFHGYSLAHTIRPLVLARSLRARGYRVELAGRGPHSVRIRQEGFSVHEVETLPQSRMDQYVARGDYAYYDMEWIDRCVQSERALIQRLEPDLVIYDMKPTADLSARLEGVDAVRITQAYNQPGYPGRIPLMDCFETQAGPFDEYLCQRAEEVKPQRSFNLLADIPEFHPPPARGSAFGFHYAGPLLDRPVAPEYLGVLDAGWDTSLPLVYLTCGSSGRSPDYLGELVEAAGHEPYRLLVTTAGRWSCASTPPNVRVVDFLPGEWVLERAEVLAGIVGIGAIYQALSCGVPIVGAPEHLDQEYHLNQVQALGLGLKLDRRDFEAGGLLAALERVLARRDEFGRRCAPFVEILKKWEGGETAAELIDNHFRQRRSTYLMNGAFCMSEAEFLHYLERSTPPALGEKELQEMLHRAIRRGIPHRRQGRAYFYDRLDSWNWLYDHDPHFFAADYWALEEKRRRFFVVEDGRLRPRRIWQRYKATYRYRLFPEGLEAGRRLKLFLPYPVERPQLQQDLRLISCEPAALEACLVPSLGFFYGYSMCVGEERTPWDFSYTCELSVRAQEGAPDEGETELSPIQYRHYLEVDENLLQRPEVVRFRRALGAPAGGDEARARQIYAALAQSKRFKKTKDQTQNSTYSTLAVLQGEGGHCITLSRAFIALCRAEGIAAREAAGALIGYPVGARTYAARSCGECIFGHTWAEVFIEGQGWLPVEFHGIVIGEGAATAENVADAELWQLMRENSSLYLDYYFGRLDNQRLLCSNSVKRLGQCLVEDLQEPEGSRKRWQAPADLRFECSLEVECL